MPKFLIEYDVRGTILHLIEADTKEDAEKQAFTHSGDDEEYSEAMYDLGEVTDCSWTVRPMFRVRREDGSISHTTYVRPTDTVLPETDAEVTP